MYTPSWILLYTEYFTHTDNIAFILRATITQGNLEKTHAAHIFKIALVRS